MISFDNVTINKNQMNSEECMYLTDFVPRVARVDLHKFMHQGPGRPFLPHYRHIVRNKNAIWLPSIAVAEIQVFQNVNGIPECKAVHLHNFKCAGTTVASSKVKGMKRLHSPRIGQLFQSEVAPSQNVFRYDDDDDNVYNEHPPTQSYPIRVFTFIRDPVSRFVSAVQQCTHFRRCDYCRDCIRRSKLNSTLLVDCILNHIEKQQLTYLDRHLNPQVFSLFYQLLSFPILIDLVSIRYVSAVLDGLGRDTNLTGEAANVNRGIVRGYNLPGVSILTDDQIRRVCRLYDMDVRLVRETGLTTTLCDDPLYSDYEPWIPVLNVSSLDT